MDAIATPVSPIEAHAALVLLLRIGLLLGLALVLGQAAVPGGTDRTGFALLLGVAMFVSALPVISRTVLEMRLLHRDVGQARESVFSGR